MSLDQHAVEFFCLGALTVFLIQNHFETRKTARRNKAPEKPRLVYVPTPNGGHQLHPLSYISFEDQIITVNGTLNLFVEGASEEQLKVIAKSLATLLAQTGVFKDGETVTPAHLLVYSQEVGNSIPQPQKALDKNWVWDVADWVVVPRKAPPKMRDSFMSGVTVVEIGETEEDIFQRRYELMLTQSPAHPYS